MLAHDQFDTFVENLCAPYDKDGGRHGILPGTCFRMLFIGCFEGCPLLHNLPCNHWVFFAIFRVTTGTEGQL